MRRVYWSFSFSTALVAIVLVSGCDTKGPRALVKGNVKFANKPVKFGTVTFHGADKRTASATIKDDGTYEMADAPVGDVTITVTAPSSGPGGPVGPGKPPPGMGKMPSEFDPGKGASGPQITPIPEKFTKPETSTLKYTVQKGDQDHDIEMTP
jgi:hypothetical protein